MKSFLYQVAEQIVENHGNSLGEISIVLPNRRAGLFLKKHLSTLIQKPVWSPDIFSVEDFFFRLSGYAPADPISLLLDLYHVHKELHADGFQPLEEFISWAPVLLSDFNEIDFHLIDAGNLYNYLNEAKAIEKWNLGRRALTEFEIAYLKFFNSMPGYYQGLKKRCESKKEGYKGMIYRLLAENPEKISIGFKWEKVYFAGFNALTTAEKKIVSFLVENKLCENFYDTDEYYLFDERQEAGMFLRQMSTSQNIRNIKWIGNGFKTVQKKVFITGTPKKTGQAVLAGKIVNQWMKSGESLENTAVVLADESLLMPVLNSLPASIGAFNVTMGFPLKSTPLFQLFKNIFRLFEYPERLSKFNNGVQKGFYYQDILKFFQHPAISRFINTNLLVETIASTNKVFYSPDEIISLIRQFSEEETNVLFEVFENSNLNSQKLLKLLGKLIQELSDTFIRAKKGVNYPLPDSEIEYLYHFSLIYRKLDGLFGNDNAISIKTLRLFFSSIVNSTRVPFYGEPLTGLQVLGLLETRNLDFDRIIVLSVNEGVLPSSSAGNSFIPYDILKSFNLPTNAETNAVYAYHFYRLLQRAREVHLIYDTEAGELGGGEKSRFIHQFLHEMPRYNPGIIIHESIENLPAPEKLPDRSITVKKTDAVYEAILKKAKSGFAPTSLNRFRDCQLRFYLTDVAGIDESEEVEETIEYRTLGIITHEVLENLYRDFTGKRIVSKDVEDMADRVEALLEKSFARNYKKGEIAFGRNRLIYEVIRNFIRSFLAYEKHFLKDGEPFPVLEIKELEKKVVISSQFHGLPMVTFKGTIDRVDKLNGKLRIIDYKTGLVEGSKELVFKSWDDFLEATTHTGKAFQLLMYAWLYHQENIVTDPACEAGIFSLRTMSSGLQCFGLKELPKEPLNTMIDEDMLDKFEQLLFRTLSSIFDRKSDFIQTDDPEICRTCIFKEVCNRVL